MNQSTYSPNYQLKGTSSPDTDSVRLTPDEAISTTGTPEYEQLLATYQRIKHERDMLTKAFRMFSQPPTLPD